MKKISREKAHLLSIAMIIIGIILISEVLAVNNSLNPGSNTQLQENVSIYMEFSGVKFSFKNTIPAEAYSMPVNSVVYAGLAQYSTSISGSGASTKVSMSNIVIERFVDTQASPVLWSSFYSLKTFTNATIRFYTIPSGSTTPSLVLTITISGVHIQSIVDSYTDTSSEQITFTYTQITLVYINGTPVTYTLA